MAASIVKSLRLLADATRLRLLLLLERAELTVAEIQEILGMGQSRISTHLAQLKAAGLVRDRRAGKNIYYGPAPLDAADRSRHRLREIVLASADEIAESAKDRAALDHVLRKREDRARDYFNRLAGKFGRTNCPGRSWRALSHLLLPLLPPLVIADLGAGEGELAQLLAAHAKKVIAIDSSEKMVEFGRKSAREHGVKMAILTVPAAAAQEVANLLVESGIAGILNFSPIVLSVPEEVMVNNVNLAIELENLSYFTQE